MKLEELFNIIPETSDVIITDIDEYELARYDGRCSVDTYYNNKEVYRINAIKTNVFQIRLNLYKED